ncbi:MAG: hypothetical protein NVS4B12_09930 [Ktedonobacteraceae bacterium]
MSDKLSISSPKLIEVQPQSVHTTCDIDGHCITCSDEAVAVEVISIDDTTGLALVTVEDVIEEVDITLLETVTAGDSVLVHGGVAIAHLGKAEHE